MKRHSKIYKSYGDTKYTLRKKKSEKIRKTLTEKKEIEQLEQKIIKGKEKEERKKTDPYKKIISLFKK